MKLEDVNDFKNILKLTLESFEGGSKDNPFSVKVNFELSPREYLKFAGDEMDKGTPASLINCVSHLKRALDCQLDIFLETFNLLNLFRKRNLKIEKKLELIGAIGYLSSRSLVRLNTIRNKMEHDYTVPKIQDIEVYFDLITALVHLLELGVFVGSAIDFYFNHENSSYSILKMEYVRESPEILITCESWEESCEDLTLSVKAKDDIEAFSYCFKALRVLNLLWDQQSCHGYVLRELGLT